MSRDIQYLLQQLEKIQSEQIHGRNVFRLQSYRNYLVLTEFFRKNKHYLCTDEKYIRYAEKRVKRYKIRRFFVRIKMKIKGTVKKILGALGVKKRPYFQVLKIGFFGPFFRPLKIGLFLVVLKFGPYFRGPEIRPLFWWSWKMTILLPAIPIFPEMWFSLFFGFP